MRTPLAFVFLIAFASVALGASESAPRPHPSYHLHGYYKLHDELGVWELSDDSPWQVVKNEPWINARLVKWGYVPITHDSERYYCMIDDQPRTGTHIGGPTFVCGDPTTVEYLFNNHQTPKLLLYGWN
jgi:hypothetical protein